MPPVPVPQAKEHLDEPVLPLARTDFPKLRLEATVREALDAIRQQGVGEKVVYFYVLDERDRLSGVLPTRRLLTAPLDARLSQVMIPKVVSLPETATILDACEAFVMHRFLAFPVISKDRRVLGIVDVSLFTQEVLDLAEKEQTDELFEALGFHVSQVRTASPFQAFRLRFPWLISTLISGIMCALLAGVFEQTIARALILTFFLTLVLALGESVAMQSMAITVQGLRSARLSLRWFLNGLKKESGVAILLGLACGCTVTFAASVWRGFEPAALVIGGSIFLSLCSACFFGLAVPALLHWLKWDPKIAAGPLTLAITDICTLLFYFGLATVVL